ncbi:MYB DNA-binding domain protein [Aspergillus fischeri NRRL 181]|uniref:MYB DNA-binding domain protein n=1 Tax=Neosartorya fischeri (strain ATCC 1020 / DSM 3700 / CBS 544.65 / FGSC A1164 / JCM 1740 / NRRL 181 / WB 181) TaxID=331117 RepID=A1CYT4_NEOFI|nr:MYB DNA-binding domain protein [Aspergillus fischeri NRRL 181]EAW23904.1 MYB DNA-binding domain protein [Aspergillus fischeri NRRL 181]KAG2026770.1 hypothetical protein GB937_001560 [Aspergillus fischeri]
MGQGSSQPMNGGLSEPENQDMNEERDAVGSSDSPKTSKKVKSETQVEGTATPKRKRKQTVNDTNTGMPSETPNQSQESPLDPPGARPAKRTKTASWSANTKEARRLEKNGNREAIPSPETPVIANIYETTEAQRQSTDMQPLADVARTNGTASKKPKKSKAKTTQQDEEKEVSALPQTPAETKPIRMASANPSLADSSTDQKDLTDTSAARGPRKGKTDKMIGFFAPSEVSALETFKLQFCNQHAISSERFDRMVQHVDRRKDSGWPCDDGIIKKPDFWQQIYDVLPSRDRRSVYRFMRRHFQDSSQKPHHWTHEQDDELIDLVGRYGPRFAHIAKILGRVEDDVVQRWKNRLEHRSTMRRGAWSEEEVRGLLDALQASWNNLKKDGQDVGRDIYEMDEGLVSWGTVSNKLQNCRSRQQCADKWRKIRRKIMGQRSTGNQDAVYDPATEAKPQGRAKSITLAEQMEMARMLKSSEYVDSEDGDEEDMEQSLGTESQSPNIKDEGESAGRESTIISAPEKPPAASVKALNKGSQSKESQTENDVNSESEASSDSAESASDDASEAKIKSGSESGSDSDSSVESDAKVDSRMRAQSSKGQEKDARNNKASSAKSSSKPTKPTPNQKLVERSKPKTSDGKQSGSQATKTASDSVVNAETNAIPRPKASKPSKSTIKEEEIPQETSSESESDSESASDTSDSEDESTSGPEEPSDRQPAKVAPKAPTSIQKASVKGHVSQKTQNKDESEESSSTSDETSSADDNTDDSEADYDSGSDSDNGSRASDDKPVEPPKTAALKGTKRKAQEPAKQTGKCESKRPKTGQKPSKKSSPSSASASSSSEDSDSEDDADSDSEADTDESSSASDGSNSTSKPQPKSKSGPKQPSAQPKVDKAVNGQKPELSKPRTPVAKEGGNVKNGQSGAKQKLKQVKPSLPQVGKDGEKEKGKLGSTPVPKGQKSK